MNTSSTFTNPVIPGFHPDPSVCRVGDMFYLVTSSFEYFPGVPIFESTDLVSWTQIGHCLNTVDHLDLSDTRASKGVFAPTIRWHDGLFFVSGTNVSGKGHFIVHASDPRGPWSEPVWVDQNGIDPSLFFEDGVAYFQSNIEPDPGGTHALDPSFRRGIQQCIVNPLTGERLTESCFLWEGSGGRYPEAPHLYRRADYYYLLVAEGGTERGHMVTVARSSTPWGPFVGCPRNPVISHGSSTSTIQSVGHADLVELADGTWWAVMLGTRPNENWHHLGRETFLVPVEWDDEGWPVFGRDGLVQPEHERPNLPASEKQSLGTHEDFRSDALGYEWNTLRLPRTESYSIDSHLGRLVQHGTSATTSDEDCVLLARRVQHHYASAAATLDARKLNGGEAGLIVRIDEHHHAEVAVTTRNGTTQILYRRRIGALVEETQYPGAVDVVELRIDFSPTHVSFSFETDAGRTVLEPEHETRYISTEVAGGFTGAYVGLYTVGRRAQAIWQSFDYTPAA